MGYFHGFTLLKQDPAWVTKLLILSLCLFSALIVPLLGPMLFQGWLALLFRARARGETRLVPPISFDLADIGSLLASGFKPFVVAFVWQLPVVVLVGVIVGVSYSGFLLAVLADLDESIVIGAAVCLGVGALLSVPVALVFGVLSRVATARCEYADDLAAGFDLPAILAFSRQHFWAVFKALFVYGGLSLLLLPVLLVCTLYLGLFPFAVVIGVCQQVFVADLYRSHVARGGTPWPSRSAASPLAL